MLTPRAILTARQNGEMSHFATTILNNKYAHTLTSGRKEAWPEIAQRQVYNVVRPYLPHLEERTRKYIEERKLMPAGRYLYAAGRKYPQICNCFLFRAHDSREGWGDIAYNCLQALMTGGGVGVVYSDLREEGSRITGLGGTSSGPISLMKIVNEQGRYTRQGGSRRSAIWSGLHWNHPDIFKFIDCKKWSPLMRQGKKEDFDFPCPMDMTNISVILDDAFFTAFSNPYDSQHRLAMDVYWAAVRGLLQDGEPGFSVDIGENEGENSRNACCEVVSRDNCDMCNLASINLARIESPEELSDVVEVSTAFLICGTLYSKLPVEKMYRVREKNRRLGLGVMGVHEWLLQRGYKYGPCDELAEWLQGYTLSGAYANRYADKLGISRPIATRSIAPTGTISIIAETTSGIEPIFATALKRRYLDGKTWKAQYIVDATAKRLIDSGIDPDLIEDAMTLSEDVERRIQFQTWLQRHVDQGISSTINLPPWGSSINNESTVRAFGNTLMRYLPQIRGITAYPDGGRDGQPLTRAPYREAIKHVGTEFVDNSEAGCKSGVCGS